MTSAGIYLALGWPSVPRGGISSELTSSGKVVFEHSNEIAVIISLFVSELKRRLPLTHLAWSAAFRQAGPVMTLTLEPAFPPWRRRRIRGNIR